MTPDAVMVFAAGFGTRMGRLTAERPKPLIEVGGRTLLDRTLDLATAAGVDRIVVNSHYRADQIEDHLSGRPITISHEEPEILDTGGGLKRALSALGSQPVFTANPDAVFTGRNPFEELASAWDPLRMEALLLLVPLAAAGGRKGPGDFGLADDRRLSRDGDFVYTGLQILRTERIRDETNEVFSLNAIWDAMAQCGGLFGMLHEGSWCDVGHPEGISIAERLIGTHDA